MIREENTTTSVGNVQGGFKPSGNFVGYPYFDCSSDLFTRCRNGKKKYSRWDHFLKNDEFSNNIRNWLSNNGNQPFLLRNADSDIYIFAHKPNF